MSKQFADKQRVLFICPQPFFEWRGSPIRVKATMTAFSNQGHQVDLLTLPIGEEQNFDNVRIIRAWNLFNSKKISIGPSALKLWFDLVLLIQGFNLICRNKYDVLHGTEEAGFICYLLSFFNRAKVVYEKHSDSFSYNPKGILKPILSLYRLTETITIKRSNAVISTGPGLDEQAKGEARNKQGELPQENKYFVIPDTPSSIQECTYEEIKLIRSKISQHADDVIVSYAGSFASYQGIDIIFEAIPNIITKNPNIQFVIIGGNEQEIAQYKKQLDAANALQNVQFLGMIHPDKLPAYLAAADILLAPRKSGINSPLKILDYFKAGAAIVATNTTANQRLLNSENAKLSEFSAAAFSEAINELATSKEEREKLGKNAHALYQQTYNFSEYSKQLKAVYEHLK